MDDKHVQPYVKILEQPVNRARFLYECENRKNYKLPGINSTIRNKSFPTIQIVGKKGPARVIISCVTKDPPYRPHPYIVHNKQECYKGVCIVEVPENITVVTFPDLGIQCVTKNAVEQSLKMRQNLHIDPFKTGFAHAINQYEIDFTALRLCFQVFLEGSTKDKFNVALPPVVSDPLYDKRAMPDLIIREVCEHTAPVTGGKKMILLCEKILKEDIQIRFFEEENGQLLWEGYGEFNTTQIYKRTAISFRTPKYHNQDVEEPVQVFLELRRSVDGLSSEPVPFQLLPVGADDANSLRRKRRKYNSNNQNSILRSLSKYLKLDENDIEDAATSEDDAGQLYTESPNTCADFTQCRKLRSQSRKNTKSQRPQVSPGQTSSVTEYNNYNLLPQQYQQNIQSVQYSIMPNISAINTYPSSYKPNQSHQSKESNYVPDRLTPKNQKEQLINNIQNQSSQVPTEQELSIIGEYDAYNLLQQFEQNVHPIMQDLNMPATSDLSSYVPNQSQLHESETNIFEPEINLVISDVLSLDNQEQLNTQNQSPQVPPEQIPSHMEHSTCNNFTEQECALDTELIMSNMSVIADVQPSSSIADQSQLYQPEPDLLILNKEENQEEELQPVNDTSAECLLNMNTKQIGFNSNYSDIMNSGKNLSKSLSGLSITDALVDTK